MKIGARNSIGLLQDALEIEADEGVKKAIALAISISQRQTQEDNW